MDGVGKKISARDVRGLKRLQKIAKLISHLHDVG
jgi:hypothetical protein